MNDRPIGVSILAVLHLIGGVLLLYAQVVLFANFDRVSESLDTVGIPPTLLVFGLVLLAGITFASGIGMWLGTRWGWWCAAFYYIYGVARNANAYRLVSDLADGLEAGSHSAGYYFAKFGARVVIYFLLTLYFFKSNVLAYFGLSDMHKATAIGILVSLTAAIFALSAGMTWLTR